MPLANSSCPEKLTLTNFLLGKLIEPELGACENHLAECALCEETIRGLNASDTLACLTQQVLSDSSAQNLDSVPHSDDVLVSNLIRKLQSVAIPETSTYHSQPSADSKQLENRAAEVTRCLPCSSSKEAIGELGNYLLCELIGAGSTGVVYRALDRRLDRQVALKILRPSLGESAKIRFMAEAKATAAIRNNRVVTIFEVDTIDDLAFMAMEWLPGETLETRLNSRVKLTEMQTRDIAMQLAEGLRAAHQCNLVHRDIKPANVWLNQDEEVSILDFGLARIADDDPQLTATGMLAGTPNFMSPEQCRGLELDGRSDLFSLGCLLYRACTGRLPFGSTGILSTLQAIQNDVPRAPHQLNPEISEEFSRLIMWLLEKHPADRPTNAHRLIAALNGEISIPNRYVDLANDRSSAPSEKLKSKSEIAKRDSSLKFVLAICLTMLGFALWSWSPQIIRIMTNQGELIIESNDHQIEIEILKNGEVVHIFDSVSDQRIDVVAGEYKIQAKDPESNFVVTPNEIKLHRGDRKVLHITKVVNQNDDSRQSPPALRTRPNISNQENGTKLANSDDPTTASDLKLEGIDPLSDAYSKKSRSTQQEIDSLTLQLIKQKQVVDYTKRLHEKGYVTDEQVASDVAKLKMLETQKSNLEEQLKEIQALANEPRYEGRPFSYWLKNLEQERSFHSLIETCEALGALAQDSDEKQEKLVEKITPLVRKYGSKIIHSRPKTEFETGPQHLNLGFISAFENISTKRLVSFIIHEIESGTQQSKEFLTLPLARGMFHQHLPSLGYERFRELEQSSLEIAQVLLREVESKQDWICADILGNFVNSLIGWGYGTTPYGTNPYNEIELVHLRDKFSRENPELIHLLEQHYEKPNSRMTRVVCAACLSRASNHYPAGLEKFLLEIFKSPTEEKRSRELAIGALSKLSSAKLREFVPDLIAIGDSANNDPTRFGFPLGSSRFHVIQLLIKMEQDAIGALDWLRKVSPDAGNQQSAVVQLIKLLEEASPNTESNKLK